MRHFHFTAPSLSGLLCVLWLSTALAPAGAESLMERRNAIQKGTSEGVVLIGGPQDKKPGDEGKDATETTPATNAEKPTGLRGFFNKLPPPSGCPLGAARNAECPDQGITVPTGEPSPSNTPDFSR